MNWNGKYKSLKIKCSQLTFGINNPPRIIIGRLTIKIKSNQNISFMSSDVDNNNILITNNGTKNKKIRKTTRVVNFPSSTMRVGILAFW